MEKKQTAMMELLSWVIEFEDKPVKPTLTNVKEKIWQLLPKEREQIEEAFFKGHCDGYNAGVSLYSEVEFQSSDKYYTQTFKP